MRASSEGTSNAIPIDKSLLARQWNIETVSIPSGIVQLKTKDASHSSTALHCLPKADVLRSCHNTVFVQSANSVDSDQQSHFPQFDQGLRCSPKAEVVGSCHSLMFVQSANSTDSDQQARSRSLIELILFCL